jgi:hypothetical protein
MIRMLFLLALAGCSTSSSLREHDMEANLPRALGLGAFAPSCFMFCFPTVTFSHGDDSIDPNATAALMRSKSLAESATKPPSITKKPKDSPKEPKP